MTYTTSSTLLYTVIYIFSITHRKKKKKKSEVYRATFLCVDCNQKLQTFTKLLNGYIIKRRKRKRHTKQKENKVVAKEKVSVHEKK